MSLRERYSSLKQNINFLAASQSFSLEQVKDFYKASINSNRSLSRVTSLNGVFKLLEERSLLCETNVTALQCLGRLLNNQEITECIGVYVTYYLTDSEPKCNICSICCDYRKIPSSSTTQQNETYNYNNNRNTNHVDELEEAIKNISLRIGKEWKTLVRHLDVEEKTIDDICRDIPNNVERQAQEALNIWRVSSGAKASLLVLGNALEIRYCRYRGLGAHMLKPVARLA